MLTIKKIEDSNLIEDASALLYEVYIKQLGWQFSPDNPSQIRVEIKNNRHILIDRFTDSSVWFGAFDSSTIIGCIRLVRADGNNKLEIEGYKSSHVIQKYLPDNKDYCVELSKAAILKRPGKLRARIRDIMLVAFQYCQENGYSISISPTNNPIRRILDEIGCPLIKPDAFKYEPHDPSPVSLYFADHEKSEVKLMIEALERGDGINKLTDLEEPQKILVAS